MVFFNADVLDSFQDLLQASKNMDCLLYTSDAADE